MANAPDGTRQFVWHGAIPTNGTDADPDGVGDLRDNCVNVPNPRVAANCLTFNPWATLTGGQRDDDHDGYGNKCDAKFTTGSLVNTNDLTQFRASNGKAPSPKCTDLSAHVHGGHRRRLRTPPVI